MFSFFLFILLIRIMCIKMMYLFQRVNSIHKTQTGFFLECQQDIDKNTFLPPYFFFTNKYCEIWCKEAFLHVDISLALEAVVFRCSVFRKFGKIHRKTPAPGSLMMIMMMMNCFCGVVNHGSPLSEILTMTNLCHAVSRI